MGALFQALQCEDQIKTSEMSLLIALRGLQGGWTIVMDTNRKALVATKEDQSGLTKREQDG